MKYDYSDKKHHKPDDDPLSAILSAVKAVKLETGTIIRQQTGINYMMSEARMILTRLEKIIRHLERIVEKHDEWEREGKK